MESIEAVCEAMGIPVIGPREKCIGTKDGQPIYGPLDANEKKIFDFTPEDLREAVFVPSICLGWVEMSGPVKCASTASKCLSPFSIYPKVKRAQRERVLQALLYAQRGWYDKRYRAELHGKNAIAINGVKTFVMCTYLPVATREYIKERIINLFNKDTRILQAGIGCH